MMFLSTAIACLGIIVPTPRLGLLTGVVLPKAQLPPLASAVNDAVQFKLFTGVDKGHIHAISGAS